MDDAPTGPEAGDVGAFSKGRPLGLSDETWSRQAWYRDVDGGGAPTSNLSSAVSVTFN